MIFNVPHRSWKQFNAPHIDTRKGVIDEKFCNDRCSNTSTDTG